MLDNLPSPGPNSTILKDFGLPIFSQKEINQIAMISEKIFEMPGEVMKSPPTQKDLTYYNILFFCDIKSTQKTYQVGLIYFS